VFREIALNQTYQGARPQKADGLELHPLGEEVVVYEIHGDRLHYLNPSAALILEFCDGDHSPEGIAEVLREAYGMADDPSAEVTSCLAALRQAGLLNY